MKSLTYCLFFFVFNSLFVPQSIAQPHYDVVIVGAGMSGLSAAYQLNDYKVLILEKEDRIGGRVFTKKFGDIAYELGAYTAYPTQNVPFEHFPGNLLVQDKKIGLLLNGKITYCNVPLECLFYNGFSEQEIEQLKTYDKENGIDFSGLQSYKIKILNSFFNVVHSGDIADYNPKRQRDVFQAWTTDHYENGNSQLAYDYRTKINAKVELNAKVIEVNDANKQVEITFEKDGKTQKVSTNKVLITTPAPVTLNLIKNPPTKLQTTLNSINYNNHAVFIMVVENDEIKPFSYIATPEFLIGSVIQSKTQHSNKKVYYFHFPHKQAQQIKSFSQEKIYELCFDLLNKISEKQIQKNQILHTDFSYWTEAATVVSSNYYELWDDDLFNPTKNIYLTGDYLDIFGFPIGINAAILSGVRSAGLIKKDFIKTP